ncbi:flagellar biosynthesis anti-sigma factor FlgM [Sphingomonas sp. HITSZ_GF]|uniref:flagellar biosynthesis anti-sigma factor FlgM n=1 Tax=Sphingomonas sp. HITSZ_GF TaxID=3037247 RepID=UPI00240E26E3|nr:flagellar biosynthesis anti-sigma factor FlgM [Sphingomonas sp. HITSZ_GF]MDG2533734.1 flagellar biosynthesis anti-sigma factor FlgM [Sphingomonas sp. HITSZ_GF]
MVESIGTKAGTVTDRRTVPVEPAAKVAALRPVANDTPAVQSAAAEIAGTAGAQAPVDADRVARIRKAIQDNKFPLSPSTIADRLLAFKLDWKSREPS